MTEPAREKTTDAVRTVLHLNTESGWRGGENQVLLLALGQTERYRPVLWCQQGSRLAQVARDKGLSVIEQSMRGQWDLGAIRALRAHLKTNPTAIVHAHTSHAHSLAALALWGRPEPLVVTRRVDFPMKRGFFSRWKYRTAVAHHAAVSDGVRRVLLAGGIADDRVTVIWDGIDFARFPAQTSSIRSELNLPTDALVVGITAHLTDHKDHRTLLQAWAQVEQQIPSAYLLIAGSGELDADLRALAKSLTLQRVHFLGFREDVANLLRGLDVFTLTSHLEGLGSSVMDAMYCGLPVVATRAGGIPELVRDGIDGLLAPVRDATAIAKALCTVLTDSEKRQAFGTAAHERAQAAFGAEHMVTAYNSLYDRVCGGS